MSTAIRTFLLPTLALAVLAGAARAEDDFDRTISVTGEGRIALAPDMAHLSLGVVGEDAAPGAALREMSEAMAAVMARMTAAGIAEADMMTGQLSLDERWDYSGETAKFLGYAAATTLEVRVRDLDLLGSLIDAAVQDGANRLGGLRFDLADRATPLDAARRAAVADARARAELLAEGAGVTLGPLLSMSESSYYDQPQPYFDSRVMLAPSPEGAAVPVAAGETQVTANVTMVYAIAD